MDSTALLHYKRAAGLIDEGRMPAAAGEMRAGRAIAPGDPVLLIGLGACLLGLDALDEAEVVLSAARALAPGDPCAHHAQFVLLQERGDHEGAERAILQAIELDPDEPQYHALHS